MIVKSTMFIASPSGGPPMEQGGVYEVDGNDEYIKALVSSGRIVKLSKQEAAEAPDPQDAPASRGAP